jgi:TetR/AcrR family transcriptional regulator, hemagglutinin/protease regulatory protein
MPYRGSTQGRRRRSTTLGRLPEGGRRRLAPDLRRGQLLSCALGVFARRGIGRAGHAEIAAAAGVSVSTVFVYFPTREALVDAVLGAVTRFLMEMARALHERPLPAPQILREHIRAFTHSVDAHPEMVRVWLDWSTAIREDVWPRYLAFQEDMVRILAVTIARGRREGSIALAVDPDGAARLLVGSAHMLAQMKFTHRSPAEIERFVETLVRAILGGPPATAGG